MRASEGYPLEVEVGGVGNVERAAEGGRKKGVDEQDCW